MSISRVMTWMPSLCLSVQVWVANFEHPRVNRCSLYASPTGLSPYLRFGCLSCRVLYYNLRELYMKVLWILREISVQATQTYSTLFPLNYDNPLLSSSLSSVVRSFLCLPSAPKALQSSSVPVWPVVMEGVLLHSCHQQPKLWPHGGKPHLCPGGPLHQSALVDHYSRS